VVRPPVVAYVIAALAGCGKFQDPNIVVDLRVISMTANPPEQVIDIDLQNPPPPAQVLSQLVPTEVCALVADPGFDGRRLRWSMTLCEQNSDDRCEDDPQEVIGSGLLDDPDLTQPEPRMCGTVMPDSTYLTIVLNTLQGDQLHGLQGVQLQIVLEVGGEDADAGLDEYAAKAIQLAARVPPQRTGNTNPTLTRIDASVDQADPVPLPLGRCIDQPAPIQVPPGKKLRLTPIEPAGVRETYVIPTLDGKYATFTENLTYQWSAGAGKFSDGTTGGTRDPFGNEPPLFSDWTAPSASDLDGPTNIPLWIVQRDERLGAAWYESCAQVVP
jgi:hypothetical protein